ncbi:MAG: cobalt transporter [Oscillospiraceae bacterium]|nr:cobalt transporter [Oscillospiraceae bacterium]
MHIHHDHIAGGDHSHLHEHSHSHEHTHDGVAHTHEHVHAHEHSHEHPHTHEHLHDHGDAHSHSHDCDHSCQGCASACQHTPMEELMALMKYMVNHNTAHAKELADLAIQLEKAGSHAAYEQVMASVSDFEKGNMRLSMVLASLDAQ